ncbi:Pepco domain-containing protein [Microbacterium sp. 22296]|uniref:Pepco domain-containing protein n=1 Tax=Microbacterium sp. 22296 TaxID=3453903 RepID=UPI003F835E98
MTDDWTVQIYVPSPAASGTSDEQGAGRASGLRDRGGRVVDASVEALRENWHETVQKLVEIGDGIDDAESAWGVAEIEIGLTLSAKGQLLFIAEAGAEASVKITLTRRGPDGRLPAKD